MRVLADPAATSETPISPFRRRLIDAMAEAVRHKGLAETTVADVVRIAKTSRRTYYEHFATRDDCYIALLREQNSALMAAIRSVVDPDLPRDRQIALGIGAWMDAIAEEPELMLSWIREVPILGARGRSIQREIIDELVEMFQDIASSEGFRRGSNALSRETAIVLIGGLRELMAITVESGRPIESIRVAATQIMQSVVNSSLT